MVLRAGTYGYRDMYLHAFHPETMPSAVTSRRRSARHPPRSTAPRARSECAYDVFHAPPVATVVRNRNNLSPTSTIGVTSAAAAPRTAPRTPRHPRRSRRSRRKVTHACASPGGPFSTPRRSVLNETPASVDGASLPPDSPYKCPVAVGIPDLSTARVLKNKEEKKI